MVCIQPFGEDGILTPMLLACGHTLCLGCASELHERSNDRKVLRVGPNVCVWCVRVTCACVCVRMRFAVLVSPPRYLQCPKDRQLTTLPGANVNALKKNYSLIDLLNDVRKVTPPPAMERQRSVLAPQRVVCDNNREHEATQYCVDCVGSFCTECDQVTRTTRFVMAQAAHPPVCFLSFVLPLAAVGDPLFAIPATPRTHAGR